MRIILLAAACQRHQQNKGKMPENILSEWPV